MYKKIALLSYKVFSKEELEKMWGKGFEPSNPLRDRILSPAHLAELCHPHIRKVTLNKKKALFIKIIAF
jgi:hypothetical protein